MKSTNNSHDIGSTDSRQKLISAALELFSMKGFHAVSVREICDRAQVNVSLISYYFTGKQGLLGAVMEELIKSSVSSTDELMNFSSVTEYEMRLRDFINNSVDFYLENSSLMKLFLDELERGHPEAEKVFSETLYKKWDRLHFFIQKGIEAGYLRSANGNYKAIAVQILAPFFNLMRADLCSFKFYQVSLADQKFRQDLCEQVIHTVINS